MATLIENIYSKLKLMLVKKDENKNNSLLAHLRKINDHLAHRGTRFLTGDTMCCFDCELMPRLQHIRVAGKYFVDFEIPVSFFKSIDQMHNRLCPNIFEMDVLDWASDR